ncbi:MAG: caspase family protein [Bacteroidota bacterium]
MKKHLTLLSFLIYSFTNTFSQVQDRGVRLGNESQNFSAATKLVVIGVSKYQNIQSLSYAHTDALSFYNYMIAPEGGKIDVANSRMLLNEKATAANIFELLNWLVEETKENETVIFYFAGHGDLENKTLSQQGFLLANDAPKAAYMAGGTVGVFYLQQYLATLVQKNKARIILITDACRSGKLAGGLDGAASTTAALQSQWENTVKILSSQPGELSYESDKWNGGGGVFTYFLVKGMMGFADKNHDYKITLNEINFYLNDHIPNETKFSQNPSINGNPATVLATYDSIAFAKVSKNENSIQLNTNQVAQRGFDDDLKKQLDTATYHQYSNFRYCIEHDYLLRKSKIFGSAKSNYENLKNDKKASSVTNLMKSSLIAALQNKAQISLNCIMSGINPPDSISPFEIFDELDYALCLIDTNNLIYNHLKALTSILVCYRESFVASTLKNANDAIALEPDFAFLYFVRGNIYLRTLKEYDLAIKDYNKAIELAPTWIWAIKNLGHAYGRLQKFDEAIAAYQKCIKLDPNYTDSYISMAVCYAKMNLIEKANEFINKADSVATALNSSEGMSEIADFYQRGQNIEKALEYYHKAISIGTVYSEVYTELSLLYEKKGNIEKASYYKNMGYEKLIARNLDFIKYNPDNNSFYYNIACYNSLLQKKDEAIKYLELALDKGWTNFKHIKKDTDLDNIRNTNEFKVLIKKYSK